MFGASYFPVAYFPAQFFPPDFIGEKMSGPSPYASDASFTSYTSHTGSVLLLGTDSSYILVRTDSAISGWTPILESGGKYFYGGHKLMLGDLVLDDYTGDVLQVAYKHVSGFDASGENSQTVGESILVSISEPRASFDPGYSTRLSTDDIFVADTLLEAFPEHTSVFLRLTATFVWTNADNEFGLTDSVNFGDEFYAGQTYDYDWSDSVEVSESIQHNNILFIEFYDSVLFDETEDLNDVYDESLTDSFTLSQDFEFTVLEPERWSQAIKFKETLRVGRVYSVVLCDCVIMSERFGRTTDVEFYDSVSFEEETRDTFWVDTITVKESFTTNASPAHCCFPGADRLLEFGMRDTVTFSEAFSTSKSVTVSFSDQITVLDSIFRIP